VPEHWYVPRLHSVAKIRSERNRPDLQLLSVFLGRGVIRYGEGSGQVHKPSLDLSGYQVVHQGDFVLNNQQAWRGSVGVSPHHGIISPAYLVLAMSASIGPGYAKWLLASRPMVAQYVVASKGVGDIQRDVHFPWLKNTRLLIPPLPEQQAICDYLDEKTAKIDTAISAAKRQIELLQEYRTRLIADVVTGKLDVRQVDVPEEEDEGEGEPDELDEVPTDLDPEAEDDEQPDEEE